MSDFESNIKLYPCKKCGIEVPIRSKGLCNVCRFRERKDKGELSTTNYRIPKFTKKNQDKRKESKSCLDNFFYFNIQLLSKSRRSQESDTIIKEPSKVNICHIFPKRIYKSVQCNLDNCIYLTFSEHSRFDTLLDNMDFESLEIEFPNAWKIVIEKVKKLLPYILEKKNLYFNFVEYIKK